MTASSADDSPVDDEEYQQKYLKSSASVALLQTSVLDALMNSGLLCPATLFAFSRVCSTLRELLLANNGSIWKETYCTLFLAVDDTDAKHQIEQQCADLALRLLLRRWNLCEDVRLGASLWRLNNATINLLHSYSSGNAQLLQQRAEQLKTDACCLELKQRTMQILASDLDTQTNTISSIIKQSLSLATRSGRAIYFSRPLMLQPSQQNSEHHNGHAPSQTLCCTIFEKSRPLLARHLYIHTYSGLGMPCSKLVLSTRHEVDLAGQVSEEKQLLSVQFGEPARFNAEFCRSFLRIMCMDSQIARQIGSWKRERLRRVYWEFLCILVEPVCSRRFFFDFFPFDLHDLVEKASTDDTNDDDLADDDSDSDEQVSDDDEDEAGGAQQYYETEEHHQR